MLKTIVNSPVRSGDQTIVNGDLVIGTSGEGVNFTANTPAAGMTSQLLNWYEEGTWTPAYATWTTAPTTAHATYTRVGRQVTVNMVADGGVCNANSTITGLPFTSGLSTGGASTSAVRFTGGLLFSASIANGSASIQGITATAIAGGVYWSLSVTYFV